MAEVTGAKSAQVQILATADFSLDVLAELRADNPAVSDVVLRVFADALLSYVEAAENIRRNGAVVAHPRTGAPLENPYLKIRDALGAKLARARAVKADRVLALLEGGRRGDAE